MKTIRTAVFGLLLVAGVTAIAEAQGGGARGGGQRGGGRGGVLSLLSGVTDSASVAAKAQEIQTTYAAQTQPIQQAAMTAAGAAGGGGGGRGGFQLDSASTAKIAEINAKRNAEIRALLTKEEDKKKFDENVAAQAAARGRRGGGF